MYNQLTIDLTKQFCWPSKEQLSISDLKSGRFLNMLWFLDQLFIPVYDSLCNHSSFWAFSSCCFADTAFSEVDTRANVLTWPVVAHNVCALSLIISIAHLLIKIDRTILLMTKERTLTQMGMILLHIMPIICHLFFTCTGLAEKRCWEVPHFLPFAASSIIPNT